MTGVIVAQQWEPIIIVIPTAITPIVIVPIVIPFVILIAWPCLRRVGHPFASTISG
jgi:hypothetical protein